MTATNNWNMNNHRFSENVKAELEAIRRHKQEYLDEEMDRLEEILKKCEPPLEQLLTLEFVNGFDAAPLGMGDDLYLSGIFIGPDVSFHRRLAQFKIRIIPQNPIAITLREGRQFVDKKYRVDFLIVLERYDYEKAETIEAVRLVVEADGHEYHEKTKEQAQYDKSKDRNLLAQGYTVMRFTGREIYTDAVKVACEIERFLIREALRTLGEQDEAS